MDFLQQVLGSTDRQYRDRWQAGKLLPQRVSQVPIDEVITSIRTQSVSVSHVTCQCKFAHSDPDFKNCIWDEMKEFKQNMHGLCLADFRTENSQEEEVQKAIG